MFPSFHITVALASHLAVDLELQAGDAEKCPEALAFERLGPFFRVSEQGPCFTAVEEDGLGLAAKLMVLL